MEEEASSRREQFLNKTNKRTISYLHRLWDSDVLCTRCTNFSSVQTKGVAHNLFTLICVPAHLKYLFHRLDLFLMVHIALK